MKVGENLITNIKPFYVYEENNSLFIKNINEKIDKIANNIVSYCANFDDNNFIHICSIDTKGRLIHFMYKDGKLRKRSLAKVCNNINNLKNMRLFIIKNNLNIFLIEESSINDNRYKVSHYYFNSNNYHLHKYSINNIVKSNESIYKLDIDDMSNMIFTYYTFEKNNRSEINTKTLVFNHMNKKWVETHSLLRNTTSFSEFKSISTIKDDIFEYCYSISYNN